MLYTPDAREAGVPPDPARMEAMGKYSEEMTRAGVLLSQAMINPDGARVRLQAGQFTVTDQREQIAGYAFIQAQSREEAIEGTKEFLKVAGDGVTEIRQVMEYAPQQA